uniref:Serpentine receptor class gamma n=2 Tax=Caenorhabditis tropicalis TaxID=1561998 RepID=A0A1I7U7R6_9PELO
MATVVDSTLQNVLLVEHRQARRISRKMIWIFNFPLIGDILLFVFYSVLYFFFFNDQVEKLFHFGYALLIITRIIIFSVHYKSITMIHNGTFDSVNTAIEINIYLIMLRLVVLPIDALFFSVPKWFGVLEKSIVWKIDMILMGCCFAHILTLVIAAAIAVSIALRVAATRVRIQSW